jgi:hypothetical protein
LIDCKQASSQAFEQAQQASKKVGLKEQPQNGALNLGDLEQQRRSSVELGMGNISHSALAEAGVKRSIMNL